MSRPHAKWAKAARPPAALVDARAELTLLGVLMRAPQRLEDPHLQRELFGLPLHGRAFERLRAAHAAQRLGGDLATASAALEADAALVESPRSLAADAYFAAEDVLLPEPVIEHLARLVRRRQLRAQGAALQALAEHPASPADDRETFDTVLGALGAIAAASNGRQAPRAGIDLCDLLAEPTLETPWLVDGLLASGGLSLLVAKPKVGKSTLARVLALAVATGTPALGRCTTAGPVLVLALEERAADVKAHFAGLPARSAPGTLQIVFGALATPDPIAWLRDQIAQVRPVLVVLDPLGRFLTMRDFNDYAEVTRATTPLIALARDSGAHILALHHGGKNPDREAIDAAIGSTAWTGAVDTILLARRRPKDNVRTLETIQRVGPDLPETILELDAAGSLRLGAALRTVQLDELIPEIVAALGDGPRTEPELKDRLQRDRLLLQRALRQAVQTGQIARMGKGRRGAPYRYGLPSAEPQSDLF
jgi:hypothetical protein